MREGNSPGPFDSGHRQAGRRIVQGANTGVPDSYQPALLLKDIAGKSRYTRARAPGGTFMSFFGTSLLDEICVDIIAVVTSSGIPLSDIEISDRLDPIYEEKYGRKISFHVVRRMIRHLCKSRALLQQGGKISLHPKWQVYPRGGTA